MDKKWNNHGAEEKKFKLQYKLKLNLELLREN